MRINAVIAAGGHGKRMKNSTSKQFLTVKGHPILYYTLMAFEAVGTLDEILLVVGADDMENAQREIIDRYGFKKIKLIEGGCQRQDSVYNGLRGLSSQTDIVVIHDGVRPFVSPKIIHQSIEAAKKYRAVGVAVPVKDTIKVVGEDHAIKKTPDRSTLWAMQTPQTFDYHLILKAHEMARSEGFYGTDDAMLVERMGLPVRVIPGSYVNIKITTPEDIMVAEVFAARGHGIIGGNHESWNRL